MTRLPQRSKLGLEGSVIPTFEPPVVYDIPPTLPGIEHRHANFLARWYNNRPRGRSVLKLTAATPGVFPSLTLFPDETLFPRATAGESSYVIVDTPTSDQMDAVAFTYQGGHIYTVTEEEAFELTAAGFTVT